MCIWHSPSLSPSVTHLIRNLKSFSICEAQSVATISASCFECVQHLNQTRSGRGGNSFGTCRQTPVSSIYLFVRDTPNTHTHTHCFGPLCKRTTCLACAHTLLSCTWNALTRVFDINSRSFSVLTHVTQNTLARTHTCTHPAHTLAL